MHVLLIDRKPSINQGIAFFFKSKGWVVDTAFSGEEGAELARLYDYDLILSDFLAILPAPKSSKKYEMSGLKHRLPLYRVVSPSVKKSTVLI